VRARAPWILCVFLGIALAVAAVFAIWPAVGDAPWESQAGPTPLPLPAFTQGEVLKLAEGETRAHCETWVSAGGRVQAREQERCTEALFHPENRIWIVSCGCYRTASSLSANWQGNVLIDDRTGTVTSR